MARYQTRAEAEADGYVFALDDQRSAFTLTHGDTLVGEAHFTERNDSANPKGLRDFDHTVVGDDYRGSGLAGLLAEVALTDPSTVGKTLRGSCPFIHGLLERRPWLQDAQGYATGNWENPEG